MGRLQVYLSQHTIPVIRIEEKTVDTVALPKSADLPPESLLSLLKRLQFDNECSLIRTGTGDKVIALDLLTALDSGISCQNGVYLVDNLRRTCH